MSKVQDKNYWESFYKAGEASVEPSLFAKYVLGKYANNGDKLVELGCGNGRDAHYFAENGIIVDAIDQCESEIEELNKSSISNPNLNYIFADFTSLPSSINLYDLVYSRFTLHSVTEEEQNRTLSWSYNNLNSWGRICIEIRGKLNEIYGKGIPVDGQADAYIYEEHYRRFVEFRDFVELVQSIGFNILEANEEKGYAPFKGTDYKFIRVIARKP